MAWTDVPIPKKMRGLGKDARGYPIPFVVLLDTDGAPHFAINDDRRIARCIGERRCAICGSRLPRLLWFVGGPASAFHVDGCYRDTAMHHECMRYALQVCPYLAAPKYLGRIDAAGLDPAKLPKGCPALFLDPTLIPERPPLFVAVASIGQKLIRRDEGGFYLQPLRPYTAVEFWRHGKLLSEPEAQEAMIAAAQAAI